MANTNDKINGLEGYLNKISDMFNAHQKDLDELSETSIEDMPTEVLEPVETKCVEEELIDTDEELIKGEVGAEILDDIYDDTDDDIDYDEIDIYDDEDDTTENQPRDIVYQEDVYSDGENIYITEHITYDGGDVSNEFMELEYDEFDEFVAENIEENDELEYSIDMEPNNVETDNENDESFYAAMDDIDEDIDNIEENIGAEYMNDIEDIIDTEILDDVEVALPIDRYENDEMETETDDMVVPGLIEDDFSSGFDDTDEMITLEEGETGISDEHPSEENIEDVVETTELVEVQEPEPFVATTNREKEEILKDVEEALGEDLTALAEEIDKDTFDQEIADAATIMSHQPFNDDMHIYPEEQKFFGIGEDDKAFTYAKIPAIYDARGVEICLGDEMAYRNDFYEIGPVIGIGDDCFFTLALTTDTRKKDSYGEREKVQWQLHEPDGTPREFYHYNPDSIERLNALIYNPDYDLDELISRFRLFASKERRLQEEKKKRFE